VRTRRIPVSALPQLRGADWVDATRRPFVREGTAFVPVRDGYPSESDLPERGRSAPQGYQRLGDLVLFHGPRPDEAAVLHAIDRCHPRGVLWVRGHRGPERTPEIGVLAGVAGEVEHRESGIVYRLDPTRVMFSQGNREEKARLAAAIEPGERVGDLFAGIGYFTLAAARAGGRVHAMEINPVARDYLIENLRINDLSDRVDVSCGDCRDLLRGVYDRLVLGHFEAVAFLDDALRHVRSGSIIHLHTTEGHLGERGPALEGRAATCGRPVSSTVRRVKKVSPGRMHSVYDLVIQ
jgi:tRNA wybutosine-synthesizing protein 2